MEILAEERPLVRYRSVEHPSSNGHVRLTSAGRRAVVVVFAPAGTVRIRGHAGNTCGSGRQGREEASSALRCSLYMCR